VNLANEAWRFFSSQASTSLPFQRLSTWYP